MNVKKTVVWVVGGIIAIVVISVAIVAAFVGSEASKADSTMKSILSQHPAPADVKAKLDSLGFKVDSTSASDIEASGPHHRALAYGTWLTLSIRFDAQQKMSGYDLKRASTWF